MVQTNSYVTYLNIDHVDITMLTGVYCLYYLNLCLLEIFVVNNLTYNCIQHNNKID